MISEGCHLNACLGCQVACMQFINIVVHSVEDMNFRVHLQYDFTKLNLDEHLEVTWLHDQVSSKILSSIFTVPTLWLLSLDVTGADAEIEFGIWTKDEVINENWIVLWP